MRRFFYVISFLSFSMYEIPVALFYSALFLLIIYRNNFFRIQGISNGWFSVAFAVKIIFGIGNLLVWYYLIGHGDSLNYFSDSKLIYNTLPENPWHYLQLTFGYRSNNTYPDELRYVSDFMIYSWNNVEYTMVRINAILNVFTFGSAFGNVIILCFLCFCGAVALLRSLVKRYAERSKLLFLLIFFLPSLTFWGSGLLKEGMAVLLMSLLFIQLNFLDSEVRTGAKRRRVIYIIVILLAVYLIRDFLLALIIPNLIIWRIATERPGNKVLKYAIMSAGLILLIGVADLLTGTINIARSFSHVQAYFNINVSEPDYSFYALDGTIHNFIRALPWAVNNILIRPNILNSTGIFRLYTSIELILCWGFIAWCCLRKRKNALSPAILFLIFFSVELLIIYGLLVTDADTLSRYRTLPLFFMLVAGVCSLQQSAPEQVNDHERT